MTRDELLKILRDLYRKKEFEELKRKYLLGAWLLTKEDREKIEKIVSVQFRQNTPEQQSLIDYCVKELGWKLIHDK